jgi:hypothetical protein
MSKRAKLGGTVMISRTLYEVIEGPMRDPDYYRIRVRPRAGGEERIAESKLWRCGCGPWKLTSPQS